MGNEAIIHAVIHDNIKFGGEHGIINMSKTVALLLLSHKRAPVGLRNNNHAQQ